MLKHIRFYRPQDEYGFMSNYFEYRFWLDGRDWLSVEHYYQAQKFADPARQAETGNHE